MKPHSQEAKEVLAALKSDSSAGLTAVEASARLGRFGPNEVKGAPTIPAWRRFLAQFQDVLVLLLIAAAVLSIGVWVFEGMHGMPYEGLVILAILLANGVLGFVQESRAERAVAALHEMTAAEATVLRDGGKHRIPAREVVPC